MKKPLQVVTRSTRGGVSRPGSFTSFLKAVVKFHPGANSLWFQKCDCNKFFMSAILSTFKCDFTPRQNQVKIYFSVEINVNSVWNWKFLPKQTFTWVGALSHWDFYMIMCNKNTFNYVSMERHVISNAVSLQLNKKLQSTTVALPSRIPTSKFLSPVYQYFTHHLGLTHHSFTEEYMKALAVSQYNK